MQLHVLSSTRISLVYPGNRRYASSPTTVSRTAAVGPYRKACRQLLKRVPIAGAVPPPWGVTVNLGQLTPRALRKKLPLVGSPVRGVVMVRVLPEIPHKESRFVWSPDWLCDDKFNKLNVLNYILARDGYPPETVISISCRMSLRTVFL